MPDVSQWPNWAATLTWSLAVVAVGWAVGFVLGGAMAVQVRRWLTGPEHEWARQAAGLARRRLPWWFALVGLWLASGSWPLSLEARVFVEKGIFVVGALSVTLTLATVASRATDAVGALVAPGVQASSLTRNISWALVAVLGALVVLNGLGLSITPMLTALGIGGLAVALALQEPLANFFAGLFVTLAGQIRVGDYIKLDSGQEGYVADFSWRSTRLRMLANNVVIVPNAKLAHATVVNHDLPSKDMAVLVEVGVDYASDLEAVERTVMEVGAEVMRTVTGGVPAFEPFVRYHTFGESSVNFTAILRAQEFVDQYLVKHEFIKRLHARFDQEGIVIPFPIRTIAYRDAAAGEGTGAP
ncbi:MAG TPA: mechanosensitive ion channel family protein [Vicinamibacterales bacterium]|nr:mechanosensitive ion channel family protein [Vicinamibacterales bacterium]